MVYDVTYLNGTSEQTDRIEAPDAASAAASAQAAHDHDDADDRYELLLVQRVSDGPPAVDAAA